jgi:uncharacterized protein YegP (UPF0339 family)
MTGTFELIEDTYGRFQFRLLNGVGEVLAVSGPFSDKKAAVAAIVSARENAAMALITDLTAIPTQQRTQQTTPMTPIPARLQRGPFPIGSARHTKDSVRRPHRTPATRKA